MAPAPVDWDLARKVAAKAGQRKPFAQATRIDPTLEADFAALTTQAEALVAAETGLHSLAGPARARVADRTMWVDANIRSFQRLLRPFLEKVDGKFATGWAAPVTKRAAGLELGVMLGWMSARVLGQYDLLVVEDEAPDEQDIVYYVGPNVLAMERRYALPPKEFRLWLALHETTHRAQFTGVPWLRPHFLSLVDTMLKDVEPDPARLIDAIQTVLEKKRAGDDPLADGGVMALIATPEQRGALERIGGMMSLLEGHGDVTMDRAGAALLPSAPRFARILKQRRRETKGLIRLLQRLVGLDAKIQQYAQGETFIHAVEAEGGQPLLRRAWESPEHLPTLAEIRQPKLWIERMAAPLPA